MGGGRGRFLLVLYLPSILSRSVSGSVVELSCSEAGSVVGVLIGVVVLAVVIGCGSEGW